MQYDSIGKKQMPKFSTNRTTLDSGNGFNLTPIPGDNRELYLKLFQLAVICNKQLIFKST